MFIMWFIVLVLVFLVICELVWIGLVVFMFNRCCLLFYLFIFLCGGYMMVGGVVMVMFVVFGVILLVGYFSVVEV